MEIGSRAMSDDRKRPVIGDEIRVVSSDRRYHAATVVEIGQKNMAVVWGWKSFGHPWVEWNQRPRLANPAFLVPISSDQWEWQPDHTVSREWNGDKNRLAVHRNSSWLSWSVGIDDQYTVG